MNVGRERAPSLACLPAPSHQVMLNPCQNYGCKTLSLKWKKVKAWLMRKMEGTKIQAAEPLNYDVGLTVWFCICVFDV